MGAPINAEFQAFRTQRRAARSCVELWPRVRIDSEVRINLRNTGGRRLRPSTAAIRRDEFEASRDLPVRDLCYETTNGRSSIIDKHRQVGRCRAFHEAACESEWIKITSTNNVGRWRLHSRERAITSVEGAHRQNYAMAGVLPPSFWFCKWAGEYDFVLPYFCAQCSSQSGSLPEGEVKRAS